MAQLIGQKLVVRMEGTTPSADLLGRIRRGEVGGVILFSFNITTPAALVALTGKLQAAALAGGGATGVSVTCGPCAMAAKGSKAVRRRAWMWI